MKEAGDYEMKLASIASIVEACLNIYEQNNNNKKGKGYGKALLMHVK